MSSSEIWSTGSDGQQAGFLGRHIGRGQPSGRIVSQIGYYDRHGNRIIRKWDKSGVMIETNLGKRRIR